MNQLKLNISSSVIIRKNRVFKDGIEIFSLDEDVKFPEFIRALYEKFQFAYPKFFKADDLCKLALAACEILLSNQKLNEKYQPAEIGLVITNSQSSSETDIKHQISIQNEKEFFPSPAVFVYTLPNIMIGEICIRNNFKGENAFFIFDEFNSSFLCNYAEIAFANKRMKAGLFGKIDFFKTNYEASLFLLEETNENQEFQVELSEEKLLELYKIA